MKERFRSIKHSCWYDDSHGPFRRVEIKGSFSNNVYVKNEARTNKIDRHTYSHAIDDVLNQTQKKIAQNPGTITEKNNVVYSKVAGLQKNKINMQ